MTESLSKFLWEREKGAATMESCYKLYTWINHTILMLLLQIFWKMSQISDYFKEKSTETSSEENALTFSPLTKEFKLRRHIRSMSDVQSSTPYRINFRSRNGSYQALTYDSDTRTRRNRSHRLRRQFESTDSSDSWEAPRKVKSLEHNIMKHSDSMRVL